MDFQKAFDKVPHKRLIKKAESYGIGGVVIQWIEAFLTDREQKVRINSSYSINHDVSSGIPQGSVLGPLLFVLYINDLPDAVNSPTYLFADDTKIFRGIHSQEDSDILQEDIEKLFQWSNKWLLKFHPDKCVTLSINSKMSEDRSYSMGNTKLKSVKQEKDIGIIIDSDLSFGEHISCKVNKANKVMGLIRRTFSYLDNDMFRKLFKALVRPHLEYGSSVWHPNLLKDIRTVENVQRRATKMLPGMKHLSYEERLRLLHLPTLAFRRTRDTYKLTSGKYDKEVGAHILKMLDTDSAVTRGHSSKLFLQRANKAIRQNSFGLRVVKLWNSLPEDIVEAPSIYAFERRYDKFMSRNNSEEIYTAP